MFIKSWNVLLVDDEPDVLAVSRLALKNMTCWGVPIKLHEMQSKKQALEFLKSDPEAVRVAVALIDVVMETDQAGLDVCQFIREEMKDWSMAIVIRTGQPGKAPERSVIDRYDISGYLSKMEATQERLYSVVKGAVRNFASANLTKAGLGFLSMLSSHVKDREDFLKAVHQGFTAVYTDQRTGKVIPSREQNWGWACGDAMAGTGIFEDRALIKSCRDKIVAQAGQQLSPSGDKYVRIDKYNGVVANGPAGQSVLLTPGDEPLLSFELSFCHMINLTMGGLFWGATSVERATR